MVRNFIDVSFEQSILVTDKSCLADRYIAKMLKCYLGDFPIWRINMFILIYILR